MKEQAITIGFVPLSSVDPEALRALLNDQRVARHMPLASTEPMSLEQVRRWIDRKEEITRQHGFGPQAILIDGTFGGWGGIEPDGDGASVSLVLLPSYWGYGRRILEALRGEAFGRLGLPYLLVEFPPSRTRLRGLLRLGFVEVGEKDIEGERFVVFRLDAPPRQLRERLGSWIPAIDASIDLVKVLEVLELPDDERWMFVSRMDARDDGQALAEVLADVEANLTGRTRERLVAGLHSALD